MYINLHEVLSLCIYFNKAKCEMTNSELQLSSGKLAFLSHQVFFESIEKNTEDDLMLGFIRT